MFAVFRKTIAIAAGGMTFAALLAPVAEFADSSGAASISGQAEQPGIDPLEYDPTVQVQLYDAEGTTLLSTVSASNYQYSFTGLSAGSYTLYFSPEDSSSPFTPSWWKNEPDAARAQVVTVADGQAVTGINGTLYWKASISGHVTLANGANRDDAGEVDVRAYPRDSGSYQISEVDGLSEYTVAGLEPGTYSIQFYPDGTNGYQPIYYAQPVTVTRDEHVGEIDIVLSSNQLSLAGAVFQSTDGTTPIAGAQVSLHDGSTLIQQTAADASGQYSFYGVPDGSYTLEATAPGWVDQWWQNQSSQDTAEPINISVDEPAANLQFALQPAAAPPTPTATPTPTAAPTPVPTLTPTASSGPIRTSGPLNGLAATGSDIGAIVPLALGAFLLGGALLLILSRTRRSR